MGNGLDYPIATRSRRLLSLLGLLLGPRVLHGASILRWRIPCDKIRITSISVRLITLASTTIVCAAKALSESSQSTSLIQLDVLERLFRRLPQECVAGILCGSVDWEGRGGAHGVGGAVGQGDELSKGVWPARSGDKGGVTDLAEGEACW